MKTITIKQPFATLIAEGLKEYEFRTWKTKYRGDVLIHAGNSIDKEAMTRFSYLNLNYPTGCIIAKATITDCICVDENFKEKLKEKDPKIYHGIIRNPDWNGYGFKLEKVEKISPIQAKGQLSLWEYEFNE